MNQKILQIAEQAGFMLLQKESWNPGDKIDWSARYDEELKKFFELLINECTDFYDAYADHSSDKTSFALAKHNIKKHFGIN